MLLLHLESVDEDGFARQLRTLLGDYPVVQRGDSFEPKLIRYIAAWKPQANAFDGLDNLKAILSLGAGVDALIGHPGLPDVPIVRFVDRELTQCMSDYVVANALMHHRCLSRYLSEQAQKNWSQFYPPPAWNTTVGVMGLGVLGSDAAQRLKAVGFDVRGWSRSQKTLNEIQLFHGESQFDDFLSGTDILVNLLPLTPQTRKILNHDLFRRLRSGRLAGGPVLINAARGGHQVEADIVRALEEGTLGAASLDVFNQEPLPAASPLWSAKNCYVTPHIAAISNPDSGAAYFARAILEHEAGAPLPHVVDGKRGY